VNEYLRSPQLAAPRLPFTPLTFLLVCIQPAVVEEFFFRYLAMNAIRRHVGMHGTVWVVAVMFGLAHIGQPIGIPVLILAGVFLGYARILSGGLLLPMLLHLIHNTVFLYLQTVV
jgi:CAAX protease family protein